MRKLVLGIPAQASGKNLTRPLMPSAPRTSCVHAASPHHRKLGAGYATLPQMTGRRFGCHSRSPLALRTTGIQNDLRLPGTTSLRVRSPWLAANGLQGSGQTIVCRLPNLQTQRIMRASKINNLLIILKLGRCAQDPRSGECHPATPKYRRK